MFLGTYHNRLHGQPNDDTIVVEETYNLLTKNKKLHEGENINLDRESLIQICDLAKTCLLGEETVLRLQPRLHIVGDLRGNYNKIWNFINTPEATDHLLFLGDYVNTGKHSLELMTLVLCMKILSPKQVFLLRGGQETPEMTAKGGFKNECVTRYDKEVYQHFLDVFDCMPLAAIVTNDEKSKSILFMNGGLSPNFTSIRQLEEIQRPLKNVESGLVHEILFSDPSSKVKNFSENKGTNTYLYGAKAVHNFLKKNHLDQIINSHQKNDFYYPFGDDHSVLTMYSANGMNIYIREDMLYTFSNRTNLNSYEEKLNNYVDPIVRV